MKTKILNVIAFLFFMATGSMAETVFTAYVCKLALTN